MKVYKLTKPKDYKGLFAESLVTDPAIESNLMAFDAEKPEFTFAIEEQRIIYAPALIPNKLIFRKNIQGEPAHVYFDSETIKDLWIDFNRNGGKQSVNINHSKEEVNGVFAFESWIVEDNQIDKSFKMGFDVPNGTLMKGYKIDNDEVWNEIKLGNLKGLSIEGQLFPEEQVTQLKKENMNKKGLIQLAIEAFKNAFKFADMTDYGGGFFGTALEVGAIISDKDGNPMPNASFTFENKVIETDDMGAILSVEDAKVEADEDAGGTAELDAANAKILELETKITDLEAQLSEATATKMSNETDLQAKIVKLEADIIEALKIKNVAPAVMLSKEEIELERFKNQHLKK